VPRIVIALARVCATLVKAKRLGANDAGTRLCLMWGDTGTKVLTLVCVCVCVCVPFGLSLVRSLLYGCVAESQLRACNEAILAVLRPLTPSVRKQRQHNLHRYVNLILDVWSFAHTITCIVITSNVFGRR
jgi:hypothetical protein